MSTLEELKKNWEENQKSMSAPKAYDQSSLEKIFKSRTKKQINMAMKYFWAALFLQILVYALLSHVIIKYWQDPGVILSGVVGILIFIPFTTVLMKKFKRMAITKVEEKNNPVTSLYAAVLTQFNLLQSFYIFKKRYELFLIPLSSIIGIVLTFNLYIPGGVVQHLSGAAITFILTLFSCVLAIRAENKRNFEQPLNELREILNEFKEES